MLNLSIEASDWKPFSKYDSDTILHCSYLSSLPLGQLPATGYHTPLHFEHRSRKHREATQVPQHWYMSEEEQLSVNDTTSEEESSDNDSTPDEAATPLDTNQSIPVVTEWLRDVHLNDMSTNGSTRGAPTGQAGGSFKVNAPAEFSGQRNQVKTFKLQCLTYLSLNADKLDTNRKQLLFITSYLRGPAYDWILPHLEDYLEHPNFEELKNTTKVIMAGKAAFFNELQSTFGYGNEQMEAERALQTIQQRGPVSKYKAEFLTQVVKTNWDDQAIASHFYRGLKDTVKDEIARREHRPTTAKDMYDVAMKIDERLYERQMERKGGNFYRGNAQANSKAKRDVPEWRNDYYGLQKMQLDATQGKPGSRGQKKGPQQRKSKDKSQVECYGCGKKGHYKNECRARKQSHELQKSGRQESFKATKGPGSTKEEPKPATIAAASHNWTYEDTTQGRGAYDLTGTNAQDTQDGHELLSWTACYNDSCAIHLSDKMGSGYFPSRRRQSICLTRGIPDTTAAARQALVRFPTPEIEELSLDGSTPEESEEEDDPEEDSSESDGSVPGEQLKLAYYMPMGGILPRILDRLMNRKQEVFPWIDGTQYIHDDKFGQVLSELRHIVINMPVVEHSVNYHSIVREWPPVGSDFSSRGGYTTPDGVTITKTMRDKVKALKLEYGSRGEQDLHRQRVTPLSPRTVRQETEEAPRTARFARSQGTQPFSLQGLNSAELTRASGGTDRTNQNSGN